MRSTISFGLRACRSSGPSPQPSMAPGRKFSISTSASRASSRTMACACGWRKSNARDCLLRDWTCHHTEVPSLSRRHLRNGSPLPGGSILMTSAPKSARVLAAKGPAISCPSSTTLSPASGPWAAVGRAENECAVVMGISVPRADAAVHCYCDRRAFAFGERSVVRCCISARAASSACRPDPMATNNRR